MIILIPVFNDWESARILIASIKKQSYSKETEVVIVNDGSLQEAPLDFDNCKIIQLHKNMGHQRAIAIGLSYIADNYKQDVIVMDSDGEDRPEDIQKLITFSKENPKQIIFAKRAKRREKIWFRIGYRIYKSIFYMMTGKFINFGNFCLIPAELVKKVVYISDIWSHFSGGITRSRLPYSSVAIDRGKRYCGQSKMNFSSLVLHGLSSIAIYMDTMTVRLLMLFSLMIIISIGIIAGVVCIKIFTNLAIPGWASFVVIGFLIIFIQAFVSSLLLLFFMLSYRTQKLIIPARDYKDFISEI